MVPLGYELNEGRLSLREGEARIVRRIFQRYLELGSVNRLVVELEKDGLRSKIRQLSNGATRGGVPFTQGPLFYLLRNRFYIGEVLFKGEILPGPQPPLLDRALFDAVQAKLSEQWSHRTRTRQRSKALLCGLLYDDAGNKMHRLDKAAGIGRAADACAGAGFHEKGLEVALDIEQLLYETTTLLNAASLIDRMARQS
jgi:hypothetical protein